MRYDLIVSAPSMSHGGQRTILLEFLEALSLGCPLSKVLIVAPDELSELNCLPRSFVLIVKRWPKKSWLNRLFYEYVYCLYLTLRYRCELWVGLHDLTANTFAKKRVVYLHNPAPLIKPTIRLLRRAPVYWAFAAAYLVLYRIGLSKNDEIVVQQHSFGRTISLLTKLSCPDKVNVVRPVSAWSKRVAGGSSSGGDVCESSACTFLYPLVNRPFKNLELIYSASLYMKDKPIFGDVRIILTVSEDDAFSFIDGHDVLDLGPHIVFSGWKQKDELLRLYAESDALIFPSLLETWGLPLSEYVQLGKRIIAAQLPYSKEVLGDYANVRYVNPFNCAQLIESICESAGLEHEVDVHEAGLISEKLRPLAEIRWPSSDSLLDVSYKEYRDWANYISGSPMFHEVSHA